ncbi:alpha/beta hydrolase [Streptomyces palmae]|uniref:Alpha/beta hydrolase n=1 Tax=Streptomyces palmae TaxID=1701085 RepID=A0A4Z0H7Q9_9ACTN|nr:alpha/beta hydrolase [Streptomyces palmae]TGB10568.1 alpha/beta hydrolase [Streptomyces palmae]
MTGTDNSGTGEAEPRRVILLRRLGHALVAPVAPLAGIAFGVRHAYMVYHPPRPTGKQRTPANKKLPMRTMTVTTTRDAVPLRAWVVPGRGPHTVIVCHGMGRTKSMALGHIELLHKAGHHVVAYDMRNHGESGGDRRYGDQSETFTSDLRDVLDAVSADPELGGGSLALLGFSFSTWPSLRVLPDSRVAAVVVEGGPALDVAGGLGHFAGLRRNQLRAWMRGPVSFAAYRWTFRAFSMHMLRLRDWPPDLSSVSTRLMFIGGAQDTVVQAEQVKRMARHCPKATWWLAPNAMHMNALRLDRAEYKRRVLPFLHKAFKDADRAGTARSKTARAAEVAAHD